MWSDAHQRRRWERPLPAITPLFAGRYGRHRTSEMNSIGWMAQCWCPVVSSASLVGLRPELGSKMGRWKPGSGSRLATRNQCHFTVPFVTFDIELCYLIHLVRFRLRPMGKGGDLYVTWCLGRYRPWLKLNIQAEKLLVEANQVDCAFNSKMANFGQWQFLCVSRASNGGLVRKPYAGCRGSTPICQP